MFSLQVNETAVQTHPALTERAADLATMPTHKYLKSLNFLVYKIRY
jgi:hypothetical protein